MTAAGDDSNRQAFDDVAAHYQRSRQLAPAERALLLRFRGRWDTTDVLDLGVGTGRTAYTFAAVAREYVGLDYAPAMIELARRAIGEDAQTHFLHGDARDLSELHGRSFDLVLFSFNGLDYVHLSDRMRILHEVRRVIAPGGCFAFSSHSLAALPFRISLDEHREGGRLVAAVHLAKAGVNMARARRANRELDLAAARDRGWGMVRDAAHGFKLNTYYCMPAFQVAQLRQAGFADVEVVDRSGAPVEPDRPPGDAWLHYTCGPS